MPVRTIVNGQLQPLSPWTPLAIIPMFIGIFLICQDDARIRLCEQDAQVVSTVYNEHLLGTVTFADDGYCYTELKGEPCPVRWMSTEEYNSKFN